jgi:hypothetical protein
VGHGGSRAYTRGDGGPRRLHPGAASSSLYAAAPLSPKVSFLFFIFFINLISLDLEN